MPGGVGDEKGGSRMTENSDGILLLAGIGNMGQALLSGWFAGGLDPTRVVVQDPMPPAAGRALLARHGIAAQARIDTLPEPPAVIVLAVKPQAMDEVLPPLAPLVGAATVVLSIAAGRTIAGIARHLAADRAVIRAMPNTPAAVGRGMTVAVANAPVTPTQRARCDGLLRAVGDVAWVEEEALLDAVTAVSGSGPAYVFYLAECLAEAGRRVGLAPELAERLARTTVAGAGELLHRSTISAQILRQNVTSPNGTTHAALNVLMADNGFAELMSAAVAAATARSRELAN
jgi:pyrroline-5-carboxylate reductase